MQPPRRDRTRTIDSPEAARALFAGLADARDERLCVAHLDAQSRLIGLRFRFGKTGSTVPFSIRAIVADALALHSSSLIVAHNHPSGDPDPTAMDIDMTRSLLQATRPLGLTLRDHLIFGGGRIASFRDRGLL